VSRLADRLRARIRDQGPLPVADYIAACLTDPDDGYYTTRDPFGHGGDFTTAPEISQAFGELIGLWAADVWRSAGRPSPVALVELGPGRGTLMADALRAIAQAAPDLPAALQLHFVEASAPLTALQRQRMADMAPDVDARWWPSFEHALDALPADLPALVIANEFIDALPVCQFVRRGDGWRMRSVGLAEDGRTFVFVDGDLVTDVPPPPEPVPEGGIVETCPAALALADRLAARIARTGLAALIVDFGPRHPPASDTLQAVRRHRFADLLSDPGEVDLAHEVDFAALRCHARNAGAAVHGPVAQGLFLGRLGIDARAATLMKEADPAAAFAIEGQVRRLVHPGRMGVLFQALAITPPGSPPPPGFQPAQRR